VGFGQHLSGRIAASSDQGIHVRDGEVETGKPLDVGPNQDVFRSQGLRRLLKQKAQQSVGEHDGRVEIERIGQALRRIRYDDPLCAGGSSYRDRHVRDQTAIGQDAAVQRLGREDQGNGKARPNRAGQVAGSKNDGRAVGQVGGNGAKGDRQGIEIPPGKEIASQHGGVDQGVDLGLRYRGVLKVESPVTLLPDDQRLQQSERPRRSRLVSPKEIGDGQGARERIDLAPAIAARVHTADDGTHAAADHQVGANTQAIEYSEDTDVGQSFGTPTGENQSRASRTAALAVGRRHGPERGDNEQE
jgi:hypothetical protein